MCGEIEIDTARFEIVIPRNVNGSAATEINSRRSSLNKIGIIHVALKFLVARGRPANNYVSYLHITRDRRRYGYFSVLIRAALLRAEQGKTVGICIRE